MEEQTNKQLKKIIIRKRIVEEIKIQPERGKCIHDKRANGYYCKECPGKGICEHKRNRSLCKECQGSSICEHNRRRNICKECGGSYICEHNRIRSTCKECGGASICEHNRRRSQCKECKGASICEHNKQRSHCKECGIAYMCEHNKRRNICKECKGASICDHNRQRNHCKECGGASICEHNREKNTCKECGGASICEHNRIRIRCKECRRSLPLDYSLSHYKNACIICGCELNSNKQREYRLCTDHRDDTVRKRVEYVVRDIITNILDFPPSTLDQTVYTDKCISGKYRPDISFHTPNLVINIEVDEGSHKSYDLDCEIKRLVNMKDAYPDQKLLVLRINPDACKSLPEGIIDLIDRTHFLIEVLREYLNNKEYFDELEDKVTNVAYFFYSSGGRQHILRSVQEVDKVKVLDEYYCDK